MLREPRHAWKVRVGVAASLVVAMGVVAFLHRSRQAQPEASGARQIGEGTDLTPVLNSVLPPGISRGEWKAEVDDWLSKAQSNGYTCAGMSRDFDTSVREVLVDLLNDYPGREPVLRAAPGGEFTGSEAIAALLDAQGFLLEPGERWAICLQPFAEEQVAEGREQAAREQEIRENEERLRQAKAVSERASHELQELLNRRERAAERLRIRARLIDEGKCPLPKRDPPPPPRSDSPSDRDYWSEQLRLESAQRLRDHDAQMTCLEREIGLAQKSTSHSKRPGE